MELFNDTISAISTPIGEGGIAIVRISGKKSLEIAANISDIKEKILKSASHKVHYGHIIDENNNIIDEVLFIVMRAPKTFTKEDIVEINCHGGLRVAQRILEETIKKGAKLAQPGEFTKRAFLNGRIDLVQAEGIIDMIKAKTDKSLNVAMMNLSGKTSKKINEIKQEIIDLLSQIELSIDFIEEDINIITLEEVLDKIKSIKEKIYKLSATYKRGHILQEGARIAIIGKPNVGKSSLMNALLDKDRAIVTDIPGTTRDIIEDIININGITIKLLDTAGLRETKDVVEKIGVQKTKESIEDADLLLVVLDISKELTKEDYELLENYKEKNKIIVLNKIDLVDNIDKEYINEKIKYPKVYVSAKNEEGILELNDVITEVLVGEQLTIDGEGMLTRERHKIAFDNSLAKINEIYDILKTEGLEYELLAFDLRFILDELGTVTGEVTPEDILDNIFSKFCIGK